MPWYTVMYCSTRLFIFNLYTHGKLFIELKATFNANSESISMFHAFTILVLLSLSLITFRYGTTLFQNILSNSLYKLTNQINCNR